MITGDSTYQDARFSPDGRFIAYVSDDSSRLEVYVQELVVDDGVKGGARRQLSTSGGTGAHWRDDGREIIYLDPKEQVTAVSIEPQGDCLKLGTPRVLFRIDGRIVTFDAAGDHHRFLVARQEGADSEPLHVVLNWTAGCYVYRSFAPALPPSTWTVVAIDIIDVDAATPDIQWVDDSGDVSPTGV